MVGLPTVFAVTKRKVGFADRLGIDEIVVAAFTKGCTNLGEISFTSCPNTIKLPGAAKSLHHHRASRSPSTRILCWGCRLPAKDFASGPALPMPVETALARIDTYQRCKGS